MVNKYNYKQLTYFDALNRIQNDVPIKFKNEIVLKRKLAYLNFSSILLFKNVKKVREFKAYYYLEDKIDFDLVNVSGTNKFILKIADKNYLLSIILYIVKNIILKTNIYTKIKSERRGD